MRVLLDECVPKRLRTELTAHTVRTDAEMGWSGVKNGELLQKEHTANRVVYAAMGVGALVTALITAALLGLHIGALAFAVDPTQSSPTS